MKMTRKQYKKLIKEINKELDKEEKLLQEAGFYATNAPTADELYRLMGGACKLDDEAIRKILDMLKIKIPKSLSTSLATNFNMAMKILGIPHKVCVLAAVAAGYEGKLPSRGDMGGGSSGSDSDDTPSKIFQNYVESLSDRDIKDSSDKVLDILKGQDGTKYDAIITQIKSTAVDDAAIKNKLKLVTGWFTDNFIGVSGEKSRSNLLAIISKEGENFNGKKYQKEILKYFKKQNKRIIDNINQTKVNALDTTDKDKYDNYADAVRASQ